LNKEPAMVATRNDPSLSIRTPAVELLDRHGAR
jgi:hypothetical protein